jgi:hypothetical protein
MALKIVAQDSRMPANLARSGIRQLLVTSSPKNGGNSK